MNTNTDGVSAMSAELEHLRLRAALARIANMPGHSGSNMRQLAGDALGWPSVYQRDCHACLNGHGTHHTLCPEHPKKPTPPRYEFDGENWVRSNIPVCHTGPDLGSAGLRPFAPAPTQRTLLDPA